MSTPTPAVAYYRMSTERQDTSITDQRTEVSAYAAKHGYTIIREYKDEGISGDDTERRLGFQRMLKDASERGDFQVVLCWDQDRFGRFDPLEAGYWIKPLRDVSVRLETVAQGRINWEDFAGRIVYSIQQEGKHAFLRDMSRNTTRGMLTKARQGKWLGGPISYGYAMVEGSLVPAEPEANVVRWLFNTYARRGVSLGYLASDLNERHVPGPMGGLWHKTTVHKMLQRPCYLGNQAWNRRHDGKYHEVIGGEIKPTANKKKRRYENPAQEWVVMQNTHEPLVDQQTFDTVQVLLKEQRELKTPKKRNAGLFIFTGLVFCMHCGSPMHGCTNIQKHRNKKNELVSPKKYAYRRYICGSYNRFGKAGCACNTVPEQHLLNAVIRRVLQDFLNPDNLDRLREEIGRQLLDGQQQNTEGSGRLRVRLAELDRQISQGNERLLLLPVDLVAGAATKVREWQAERERVQADLNARSQATGRRETAAADVERIMGKLQGIQDGLQQAEPRLLKEVIRQAVAKVECSFTHHPYGKKGRLRSAISHGLIHLRPDLVVLRDVPSASPQDTTLYTPVAIPFTAADLA